MRVFVTGASGWIGSAVVPELQGAGHEVIGLARSAESASALEAAGAGVVRGDLRDLDLLASTAAGADAVVHLAFGHDFSRMDEAICDDRAVVDAVADALAGTGKALSIASGTPALSGRISTERDVAAPRTPAAARDDTAVHVAGLAERGIRSSVVRLPRSVHGAGERHGFVARLIDLARESGVAGIVGDGDARWPAVHVRDAARLFRLAIEQAEPGAILHAVGEEGVRTGDLAELIGERLGIPVATRPAADFGFLGVLLAIDQPASSVDTRRRLRWTPRGPFLLDDLAEVYGLP